MSKVTFIKTFKVDKNIQFFLQYTAHIHIEYIDLIEFIDFLSIHFFLLTICNISQMQNMLIPVISVITF